MKIYLLSLFLLTSVVQSFGQNSNGTESSAKPQPTSIGIVIYSNDIETVWNAFRLANYSKNQGDTISVFLLAKGVEVDSLVNENEDLKELVNQLLDSGGTILGCGTCLQSRNNDAPQVCKFSSMGDLYRLVRKSKIVLTF